MSAESPAGAPAFDDVLLSQKRLREIVPVSAMSLWRWRRGGIFPQPIVINGRNFWELSRVRAWIDAQRASADPSGGPKAA